MESKKTAHVFRGMQKDLSTSKRQEQFLFDAKNIRITNREDSTLLSITNEKGTSDREHSIEGKILGYNTFNDNIIVFSKNEDNDYDVITLITPNELQLLYNDNKLNFNINSNIESLISIESEYLIKVYWVDGVNQSRLMIISKNPDGEYIVKNPGKFDFSLPVKLEETITVKKSFFSGSFHSGVIQYAFNYYNKYGQETPILNVTPIYYISPSNKGAKADEIVSNSFTITIDNIDTNFNHIKIYSIHRTSLDSIPTVKLVTDSEITDSTTKFTYTDTGNTGELIDPTELLYKGGDFIIAKTLAQKDGTLFLGNIEIKKESSLPEITKDDFTITWENAKNTNNINSNTGYYPYASKLDSADITTFKSRETYRLGVQFQDTYGVWSVPIFIGDSTVNKFPKLTDNNYEIVTGKVTLTKDVVSKAKDLGFIKVRPLVVYPGEREVIAQGILCPTVFNAKERHEGTCFSQSSWFLRPFVNKFIGNKILMTDTLSDEYIANWDSSTDRQEEGNVVKDGAWAEFRHYLPLPHFNQRNAEIQTNAIGAYVFKKDNGDPDWIVSNRTALTSEENNAKEYLALKANIFQDNYYVDQSILTFHSPEIELQKVTNIDGCKMRLVGTVAFNSNAGDITYSITNTPVSTDQSPYKYNYYQGIVVENNNTGKGNSNAARSLISGLFFYDKDISADGNEGYEEKITHAIYPWHTAESLNASVVYDDRSKYAVLKNKTISNLKFSNTTKYFNTPYSLSCKNYLFKEDPILLEVPNNMKFLEGVTTPNILYKGNVDTVVIPYVDGNDNTEFRINEDLNDIYFEYHKGRRKAMGSLQNVGNSLNTEDLFLNKYVARTGKGNENIYTKGPISIAYKSSPHVVVSLNYTSLGNPTLLHSRYNNTGTFIRIADRDNLFTSSYGNIKYEKTAYSYVPNVNIPENDEYSSNSFLYLAELYKDNVKNKFGGDNYTSNLWYPAGDSVKLEDDTNAILCYTHGDTFFSRFDTLKTYPYSEDKVNNIVEIGSFMVETRVNLDTRYDKNKGLSSNLHIRPTNFNMFNDVYNQRDTFFNYRIIDKDILSNYKFPSSIAFSLMKQSNSEVDVWSNIKASSVIDLNSIKGEISKLEVFNNEIFAFQEYSISHILYNSRVQIPTSDGVPIEISNSAKTEGFRQVCTVGSSNIKGIKNTPNGIYFTDNNTKSLYLFNGNNNSNLTTSFGMSSWAKLQDLNSYSINYDNVNQNVYFINDNTCLGYSERLQQFESFYSYENSYIFNVKDKTYALKNNGLYKLYVGDYNKFFDNFEDFHITFTHNENPFNDKVYNAIEFRADSYFYNALSEDIPFNILRVNNEYQDTGNVLLNTVKNRSSNLKRKFRIWRATIPRDFKNKRDRIRNPWVNITLKASNPGCNKVILHDVNVNYFM